MGEPFQSGKLWEKFEEMERFGEIEQAEELILLLVYFVDSVCL